MPHTRDSAMTGALALLAKTDDWSKISAAANASPNHVSSLERWIKKAREDNPNFTDDQAERYAVLLKRRHYEKMARLSAEARRLAREIKAELADEDGAA